MNSLSHGFQSPLHASSHRLGSVLDKILRVLLRLGRQDFPHALDVDQKDPPRLRLEQVMSFFVSHLSPPITLTPIFTFDFPASYRTHFIRPTFALSAPALRAEPGALTPNP